MYLNGASLPSTLEAPFKGFWSIEYTKPTLQAEREVKAKERANRRAARLAELARRSKDAVVSMSTAMRDVITGILLAQQQEQVVVTGAGGGAPLIALDDDEEDCLEADLLAAGFSQVSHFRTPSPTFQRLYELTWC